MTISILCIDDSKLSRTFIKKGLSEILDGNDVTFEETSNPIEGIELCRNNLYDFVILDLTMPEMSGYEFLAALQENEILQKIIVLTADVQPLAEEKVLDLGAAGYLKKPFDNESMTKMLKKTGAI